MIAWLSGHWCRATLDPKWESDLSNIRHPCGTFCPLEVTDCILTSEWPLKIPGLRLIYGQLIVERIWKALWRDRSLFYFRFGWIYGHLTVITRASRARPTRGSLKVLKCNTVLYWNHKPDTWGQCCCSPDVLVDVGKSREVQKTSDGSQIAWWMQKNILGVDFLFQKHPVKEDLSCSM